MMMVRDNFLFNNASVILQSAFVPMLIANEHSEMNRQANGPTVRTSFTKYSYRSLSPRSHVIISFALASCTKDRR